MVHEPDPLVVLIQSYHELNPSAVDELSTLPSPLQFMRYVALNCPFVVRKGASDWPALQRWDTSNLSIAMGSQTVKVAITPHGNADSVVEDAAGNLVFVEPWEVDEPFTSFLSSVRVRSPCTLPTVKYAQTQNDNLRNEYFSLFADVPPSISFASVALGLEPDAVNFWLGNERSTTALHKDNYENIYVQIRGQKHFVLMPPAETACVNETLLSRGRYRPSAERLGEEDTELELEVLIDSKAEKVPVAIWDPDQPEARTSRYSALSRPIRVTLDEGDMMYLPAMWYHKVGQSSGTEGFACSVNYWYDMDFSGGFWTTNAFVRDVVLSKAKEVDYPALDMDEDESKVEGTS